MLENGEEIESQETYWQDTEGGGAVLHIEVSKKDIVFFQALFESYEGVGTVRTVDKERFIIAILTTKDMVSVVDSVLYCKEGDFPKWRHASSDTS